MLAPCLVAICRMLILLSALTRTNGRKRAHIFAAGALAVLATLVSARMGAARGGLGALGGWSGRLACGRGNSSGACALLFSLATARPLWSSRIARNSRPGNGRLFAAVGVVHVTAYGAAQSPWAASRRSLDLRWRDITSARPVRQILFMTKPRRKRHAGPDAIFSKKPFASRRRLFISPPHRPRPYRNQPCWGIVQR